MLAFFITSTHWTKLIDGGNFRSENSLMNEVFDILHFLLRRCDKRLVLYIMNRYWLPMERELVIKTRQMARLCFFWDELDNDDESQHWWHFLSEFSRKYNPRYRGSMWRHSDIHPYNSVRQIRNASTQFEVALKRRHNLRIKLCLIF